MVNRGRERSGGNSTEKDELPSEKWGVLTRAEVEDLAGAVAALTQWVEFLAHLCERMNDCLTVGKSCAITPLKQFARPHPNQVPLWDGLLEEK